MGYMGSEEFIRLQFEDYLLHLLSSAKYHFYLKSPNFHAQQAVLSEIEGDPATDFNLEWLEAWQHTENFRIFRKFTDSHLFDIVEPRHLCAGGLTREDVQRRLTQQIAELHLDERFSNGKEVLNKHIATSQKKVSSAFNNLWADIEVMREAQRKRNEEQRAIQAADPNNNTLSRSSTMPTPASWDKPSGRVPDLSSHAQAVGQKAGAYISSWGAWASERRKGWGKATASSTSTVTPSTAAAVEPQSPQKEKCTGSGLSRLRSVTERRVRRDKERSEVGTVEAGRKADGIGRLDA